MRALPDLLEAQKRRLHKVRKDYVAPPIEGMYDISSKCPEGIIRIYVGHCCWEEDFEYCLKEFVLTVFHEIMHVLCSDISEYVPYAEKVLAEIY
jgi:hypothetical protein